MLLYAFKTDFKSLQAAGGHTQNSIVIQTTMTIKPVTFHANIHT